MIPDGWKRKSLGEIADISSGSTPLRQKDEYWNQGTIPWVTTGEIDYQIIESAKEKITELALKECSLKIYDQGTILMAMYGQGITRGRIALLGINAATNQACCAISVNSSANTKFIYFQLEHLYSEIRKLGHGGNQQNLNGQIIKQIPIMFPPLLEQCRIAEVLGVWDESIDLLEKLIGRVRSRKQGLMQQLLTGKKRFKEFEGSEWKKVSLEKIADINPRSHPTNLQCLGEFVEMVSVSESGQLKNIAHIDLATSTSGYTAFINGDTLVAKITPCFENGKGALIEGLQGIGFGSTEFFVLRAKLEIVPIYLYYLTRTYDFGMRGKAMMQGSGGQQRVPSDFIRQFAVKLPSLPEQEKIAAVLSAADEEISTLEKQLATYQQQKLGLMQQLLTGKIRVGMS
jgi:type I restriction enzyme, S subunit